MISANDYGRPDYFEIDTSTPVDWSLVVPANDQADVPNVKQIIYPGLAITYRTNRVTSLGGLCRAGGSESGDGGWLFPVTSGRCCRRSATDIAEPTGQPAQISVQADQLDLTGARIRAEGLVTLQATICAPGATAGVDWGQASATLGASNGVQVISGLFPTSFQRVRGGIYAWAGNWTNTATNAVVTNSYTFNVLVVDQSLRGNFSPTVRNLTFNAKKSTDIEDPVTIINQTLFSASNLTINAAVTLSQNPSPSTSPTCRT